MEPYVEEEELVVGSMQGTASKLACFRNRQQLPMRAPHVPCYPHEYRKEKGYRQCGPWLPDVETNISSKKNSDILLIIVAMICLIKAFLLF
ncbi:unnamed protein product [Arctia plantaginis]|uniref:Uncharacterized protein n=1 Tax=Arctia plantaginis TaxID=874455 RepID=A0A8S1AII1_ARCPL|nr:unnamed protein product [Arctia plantaginis]